MDKGCIVIAKVGSYDCYNSISIKYLVSDFVMSFPLRIDWCSWAIIWFMGYVLWLEIIYGSFNV